MVAGKVNIEKAWQAAFDAGRTGIRYDIKQMQPEGNIVIVVGQFTVKVPEGGSLQDRSGNFVNVYQVRDGSALKFRVHSFSFYAYPTISHARKSIGRAISMGPYCNEAAGPGVPPVIASA